MSDEVAVSRGSREPRGDIGGVVWAAKDLSDKFACWERETKPGLTLGADGQGSGGFKSARC